MFPRKNLAYTVAFIITACLLLAGTAAHAQTEFIRDMVEASPSPPIKVYTAKRVVTMERDNPQATAVAVEGNRIVVAGSLDDVKAALGKKPYVVDTTFSEKVIVPGFIDQHLHPILGSLTLSTDVIAPEDWVLPGKTFKAAYTPEEYMAALKAANVGIEDPNEWLFTWGYHSLWHGKLSRQALDAVSATRPIVVWQRSCHEFYLNTAAINALGLTEASMQNKGRASEMLNWQDGHWWETGMNLILPQLLKVFVTPQRMQFGLTQMVAYEHANGVTAYMEPGALYTPEIWKLYQQILGAGSTPFYSYFIPDARTQVDKGLSPADSLADAKKQYEMAPDGKVSFFPMQVKLFADGAIISQLMMMQQPYLDGHKGEWLMDPKVLQERAKLYWDAGYQLHIHVNGDEGLEVVLNILEQLMRDNPRPNHRTVIVHFANSNEEQIARIARLGAIVSANSYYTVGFADKYGQVGLGEPRADMMVRSGSVLKNKIRLSFHSDLPMAPSDPLYLMWAAVNRVTPSGRVAGPDQRISVDEALRAVTIESAYSWQKEKELGSIAPGKIANLTILEQDPYAVDPMKIKDIVVWGTVFEGTPFPVPAANQKTSASRNEPARQPASVLGQLDGEDHGGDSCAVARLIVATLAANGQSGQ